MKRLLSIIAAACILTASACSGSQKETETAQQADIDYQMAVGFYQHNKTPEAIRYLTLVLANDPGHAEANHLLGFIRMGRGQYDEAVRYFLKALETNPGMLTCKNNLGAAYMHLERYEEAAVIFKELSESPLYTSPWLAFVNLGWAYYQMGMMQDAIAQTEMAISLNPELCLGYNNLGIFYGEQNLTDRAEKNLKEAIRACPQYAEPHLHLGILYSALNEPQKAYNHFIQCSKLAPRNDLGQRCEQNAALVH